MASLPVRDFASVTGLVTNDLFGLERSSTTNISRNYGQVRGQLSSEFGLSAFLTTQNPVAFSAQGGSSTFNTLTFNNANGATFSNNAGNVEISYSVPVEALSGSNGSFTYNTASFGNLNGLSFYTSNGSMVGSYTVPSVPPQTNEAVSGSNGSFTFNTLSFGNLNGLSFYTSNGSIVGSYTAGGGGGVTLSRYPDAYSLSAQSYNSGVFGGTGGSTQISVTLRIGPLQLPQNLTWTSAGLIYSANTVAGTGSASGGFFAGIYSLNAGTALSLLTNKTSQFNFVISQNSVTARTVSWWWGTNSTSNSSSLSGNVSGSFTAAKALLLDTVGASLAAGDYFLLVGHTCSTAGSNINGSSSLMGQQLLPPTAMRFGANTMPAIGNLAPWLGSVSTTTNTNSTGFPVLPASIHTSAITYVIQNGGWPMAFFNGIAT